MKRTFYIQTILLLAFLAVSSIAASQQKKRIRKINFPYGYKVIGEYVFCYSDTIHGADAATFEIVKRDVKTFTRDKNRVYKRGKVVEGANLKIYKP